MSAERIPTERQDPSAGQSQGRGEPMPAPAHAPDVSSDGETAGAPVVGSLWLDRFRVHARAEGGSAFVATVRDERSGGWFAVKIPKAPHRDLSAFQSEVSFWLSLQPHQHIVRAYYVLAIERRPTLFLEYVGGHAFNTLRALLGGGMGIEPAQALSFARQIMVGMEFASRGGEVAHLDLKPENLMVTRDGTLKITDFGLARRVTVVDGRYPFVSEGTWPYVAPEWFTGKPLDCRADVYAWGLIVYEMVTGRLPFDLDRDRTRAASLHDQVAAFHASGGLAKLTSSLYYRGHPDIDDRRLCEVISWCLQKYPGERPSSFRALRDAFDRNAPAGVSVAVSGTPPVDTADELNHAISLFTVDKFDEALNVLNRLMVREPDNKPLWLKIADLLDAVGETKNAASIRERFE